MRPPTLSEPRFDRPVCVGFRWLGQSFDHCDGCGRDIAEHLGLDWIRRGSAVFDPGASEFIPFADAMERIPLFAHYMTPVRGGRPYRWEKAG
jgi:hypothetical protein